MRTSFGAVVMLMVMFLAPGYSPQYEVVCPTGSAQIVLDPGHGGPDPGAVNDSLTLYERDLNLDIAMRTAEILSQDHHYTVALTRDDNDTQLANSERGEIANACGAVVLVEIHLNAATDPDTNYSETFWAEKEKDLAFSIVMNEALTSLGIPVHRVDRFDNGGLLRAKMPSILVEPVFLSNPDEAGMLAQGTRQDEIARAIATGIANWMDIQN